MEESIQTLTDSDIISLIYSVINQMFTDLFASIDNNIYSLIDKVLLIDSEYSISSSIEKIFFSDKFNILILANILISSIVILKIVKAISSIYTHEQTEFPGLYILKSIVIIILMNSSLFICEQIININSLISEYLIELGSYIFDTNISFLSFINTLNDKISIDTSLNLFSLDGIIKSISTIGIISIFISYVLRYILIEVLIICSPFAFLCLLDTALIPYFKNWLKYFITLLITQNFVIIVLYIPYILDLQDNTLSKFLVIGAIYTLYKLNSYIKEFLGGFTISGDGLTSNLLSILRR